jgi:5-methyltetrahydrofolate--homocysteine methyltransferase
MEELLLKLMAAVIEGDEDVVRRMVEDGLASDLSPRRILEEAMMPAMEDIGARFSKGEAYIPELIVAAYAMEAGMETLKPRLAGDEQGSGTVVLGTVAGDIHSIGKNLVRMCLEGAGFDVVDIGEDIKTEKFVDAYKQHNPQILGLSALLSSTMLHMREVIEAVRAVDPGAIVMVGGAPVTPEFADEIGASGYAPDAFEAGVKARQLLS